MLSEVEAAYRRSRSHAQQLSTIRLRFAERRLRQRTASLTQVELAHLKAICHELRDRDVEPRAG